MHTPRQDCYFTHRSRSGGLPETNLLWPQDSDSVAGMVLEIVGGKEPNDQCRRFLSRCRLQSPLSRGENASRLWPCMTLEWMASSFMRCARRGSIAGLLARRAARARGKLFSSLSQKRRNEQDSEPASAVILARGGAARKRTSFAAYAAKSRAIRTVPFLCGPS